jgi:hypothetical protein
MSNYKPGRTYVIEDRGYKTPCHIWIRSLDEHGYGQRSQGGRMRRAHIVAWEEQNGLVPDGFELDHLCRVRACRNPDHLELVTSQENFRRGNAPNAVIWRTNVCKHGHDMTLPGGVYLRENGTRYCRVCQLERQHRKVMAKRGELDDQLAALNAAP